jgi:hypothetical protein
MMFPAAVGRNVRAMPSTIALQHRLSLDAKYGDGPRFSLQISETPSPGEGATGDG